MEIEEPVCCGDAPAFDFHSTLTRMLSPTLIGDQVVQVREPREKRLLASLGMVKALHREQLPLDGVMGLIQQRARDGHPGVCKHRIPAGLLLLEPAPDALAIGSPCGGSDVIGKAA